MKKYKFSLLSNISISIILLSLILSNVYIFIETIGCTGWGCMISMCYIVTIPAAILFTIFYWLAQKFFWCLLVFNLMIIGITGFSIFVFMDPAEFYDIRWWFLVVFIFGLIFIGEQIVLNNFKKKWIKNYFVKITISIIIISLSISIFSFLHFGNTTGVEDNPAHLIEFDINTGFFTVSFYTSEKGKITATAPLARVGNMTEKKAKCVLDLLQQKYSKNFAAYLNSYNEFEFIVLDKDNPKKEISFNDELEICTNKKTNSCLTAENFDLIKNFISENGIQELAGFMSIKFNDFQLNLLFENEIQIKDKDDSNSISLSKKDEDVIITSNHEEKNENEKHIKEFKEDFCDFTEEIKKKKIKIEKLYTANLNLKNYSSSEYSFLYPEGYFVEEKKEYISGNKNVSFLVIKNKKDPSSRVEIFNISDFEESSFKGPFSGASSTGLEEFEYRFTPKIKYEIGDFGIWIFYLASDLQTKEELKMIYKSFKIKSKKRTKKI